MPDEPFPEIERQELQDILSKALEEAVARHADQTIIDYIQLAIEYHETGAYTREDGRPVVPPENLDSEFFSEE